MITVKKDAIKYKTPDGMQSAGVLANVGILNTVDVDGYTVLDCRYASTLGFKASSNLPSKIKVLLSKKSGTESLFLDCNTLVDVTVIHDGGVVPTTMYRMYYCPNGTNKVMKKFTLEMDTSRVKNFSQAFSHIQNTTDGVEIVGELDFTSATNVDNAFQASTGVKEIRLKKGTLSISISLQYCGKLSADSIQSIIDGLSNLTGGTAQTLTFHKDIEAKLSDEQKAQITSKNWNLAFK